MKLDPTESGFSVEAEDLARLFDRNPDEVRRMMRDGSLTCLVERGEDEDAGRFRVTFRDGIRRVRLTVDAQGNILARSRVPMARQGIGPDGS